MPDKKPASDKSSGKGAPTGSRPGEAIDFTPVAADPRFRVGVGGWTFEPWRNNFYPRGLTQKRELEYASRKLTAIEINGTFYGGTKPEHFAVWREQTPPGFVFSMKAPQSVTHRGKLGDKAHGIQRFVESASQLEDRLGPINWQLDESRKPDLDDLAAFAAQLPHTVNGQRLRHVLEIRNPLAATPETLAIARQHGIATVFSVSPEHPSFADLATDFVYARLMITQADLATGIAVADLDTWAQRVRLWAEGREPDDVPRLLDAPAPSSRPAARDVFVFFINAAKARNPAAAQALLQRLAR